MREVDVDITPFKDKFFTLFDVVVDVDGRFLIRKKREQDQETQQGVELSSQLEDGDELVRINDVRRGPLIPFPCYLEREHMSSIIKRQITSFANFAVFADFKSARLFSPVTSIPYYLQVATPHATSASLQTTNDALSSPTTTSLYYPY